MAVTRDDIYGVLDSWGYSKKAVTLIEAAVPEHFRRKSGWDDIYKRAEAEAISNANIAAKKKQLATQQQDLATQQQGLATQQQAAQQRERLSNEERIRALMRAQSRGAIAGE